MLLLQRSSLAAFLLVASAYAVSAAAPVLRLPTASIALTPSGATVAPGASLSFSAQPLDRNGEPVPDVTVTWSSNRSRIVSVNAQGQALAHAVGTATLTARAGGKTATAVVSVVNPSTSAGLVAANIGQVNHVLVDDEWVYWTETNSRLVRLRKTAITGGPIYDLASEPSRTSQRLTVTYVHLKQVGDDLYWSRETFGALDHWSIRKIAKTGGPVTEVLAEDISIEPMLATGWAVAGKYLVAVLWDPNELGLPNNTRVAAYDTDSGIWTPVLQGNYGENSVHLLAATEGKVYIRTVTEQSRTELLLADPAAMPNTHQVLHTEGRRDPRISLPGAVSDTEVFYWTQVRDGTRLMAIPLAGGTPRPVVRGYLGQGLVTDGTSLYWAPLQKSVVKLPVAGGTPTTVLRRIVSNPPFGGLALDTDSLFLARIEPGGKSSIVRVSK